MPKVAGSQPKPYTNQEVDESPDVAYFGVDPGKSGGIAVIYAGLVDSIEPMPETPLDIWLYFENQTTPLSMAGVKAFGCLEQVSSSPQMGVTSAFTFGQGYGGLNMALVGAGISYELVRPQVWQKGLKIPPKKKEETQDQFKRRLRAFAQRLFPQLEIWTQPKSLGKQLQICDALLIALYCKRKHEGTL